MSPCCTANVCGTAPCAANDILTLILSQPLFFQSFRNMSALVPPKDKCSCNSTTPCCNQLSTHLSSQFRHDDLPFSWVRLFSWCSLLYVVRIQSLSTAHQIRCAAYPSSKAVRCVSVYIPCAVRRLMIPLKRATFLSIGPTSSMGNPITSFPYSTICVRFDLFTEARLFLKHGHFLKTMPSCIVIDRTGYNCLSHSELPLPGNKIT